MYLYVLQLLFAFCTDNADISPFLENCCKNKFFASELSLSATVVLAMVTHFCTYFINWVFSVVFAISAVE